MSAQRNRRYQSQGGETEKVMHAYVLDEGAVPLIPAQIAEARRINVERPAHIKTELNPWTGRRDYAEFPRGCAADQYLERCARAALAARSDEPAA